MDKNNIINDLLEAIHDIAKLKGELEAIRKENKFYRELLKRELDKNKKE